jgi:signal transduction histidine kinase/CheY-like chemotaxis protein
MDSEAGTTSTESRPEQLLGLARLVARADIGGVALLSAQGELVEHFTTGLSEDAASAMRRSPWPGELVQLVLRQLHPVCESGWPLDVPTTNPTLPEVGAFLAVPLTCPGRCRGVLYLCRPVGGEPFSPHDVEAVQSIARFLEQGSLFEEARLLARLRLMNQIAQQAAGSLELAPILRVALRELDRLLPMQVCAVWLVENTGPGLAESPSGPPARDARFPSPFADAPPLPVPVPLLFPEPGAPAALVLADTTSGAGAMAPGVRLDLLSTAFAPCVLDGEPFFADLDRPEPGFQAEAKIGPVLRSLSRGALSLGVRGAACCFAVPLRAGDRTVGILHSVCLRPSGFNTDQVQLFHLVADLLGPAISNCQLFGRLSSAYEALRHTQNQLVQTEKMRALGELAGGMAHEFNNALCGALGFLELTLRSTHLPTGLRDHLKSARVCCLDAAQTVSRVQNFARWKCDETVHIIDLDDLVRKTIELTRHKWESLAHARGTPIQVEVRTDANARVAGTPNELREVLTNLVFNAVDAMPRGGTLDVRTWCDAESVFLAVCDTGEGIAEAVQRRLFEPFFTTKGERGNGMGLSVSFGIVRRHGGAITVHSEPGKGATFTVSLPLHSSQRGTRNAERGATNGAELRPTTPEAAKSLRVLVVEDQESIRLFLDAGLTGMGHRPLLAANAREAMEAFGREPFDLVLTDLGLPEISGEEVARAVRRQSPTTPVVVLTGWADQLHAEGTALEGVERILAKPVTLAKLASTLKAVCG